MKTRKRNIWTMSALVLGLIWLVACQPAVTPPTAAPSPVFGKITFAGSTTFQPLAHKLGEAFHTHYPDVELEIAAGGSVVGIQAAREGTVDIGMVSRALKPEEAEGITYHLVALDVIAVIVHPSNPVENITLEQLRGIYLGEITTWADLGGPERPIVVGVREESSGTRGAFDEMVLDKQKPTAPGLQTAVTAGDMAALVARTPDAIGYVGLGNLEPTAKAVAIDGVKPGDHAYRLLRPLALLTGPLTQPLAHKFIEFALSEEGQRVVAEHGWLPASQMPTPAAP